MVELDEISGGRRQILQRNMLRIETQQLLNKTGSHLKYHGTSRQCWSQGHIVRGQGQGQGLDPQGQGQCQGLDAEGQGQDQGLEP